MLIMDRFETGRDLDDVAPEEFFGDLWGGVVVMVMAWAVLFGEGLAGGKVGLCQGLGVGVVIVYKYDR